MELVDKRILDMLIDDDEQLEEVYLGVNYLREDDVLYSYKEQFRLADVIRHLNLFEQNGLAVSFATSGYSADAGSGGRSFRLTNIGRSAWKKDVSESSSLYRLADESNRSS